MKPAPHIIPAVKALMVGYPESHVARVVTAITKGPRISTRDLATHLGVSRETIWVWVKIGKLPKPRHDGKQLRTFDFSEVEHLM